jgi:hypothetical protein
MNYIRRKAMLHDFLGVKKSVDDSQGRLDCLMQSRTGNIYRVSVSKFQLLAGGKVDEKTILEDAFKRLQEEIEKDFPLGAKLVPYSD